MILNMQNVVGVKELRENFEQYEQLVKSGRSFIVMKRSKPIFRIEPIDNEEWETVIDFTTFKKNGMPIDELIARLKQMR